MAYRIPLFDLNYGADEERAVVDVLRSKWISMGPRTAELEQSFAARLGVRHAIAVSNCTTGLHLALAALGVGPGDEVIVPSFTFVATVNCVGYVGATPVFADVTSREDFSIDPEHVARLVTGRTKAVIPMHYGGFLCNMDALLALARERGLAVVEDAAHAPDSRLGNRHAGSFGDAGCFSFYANKNVACGEGGMVVTNSDELARKMRLMRSHGMTSLSFDRARGHATEYDVVTQGFNFRLDDIRSALVLTQLKKLPADTAARQRLRALYEDRLAAIPEVTLPYRGRLAGSSHYILPVLLTGGGPGQRDRVRQELARRGVQTSVHYPPAHRFSIYRSLAAVLPRTDDVADHEITLPLFGTMTDPMVEEVVTALRQVMSL